MVSEKLDEKAIFNVARKIDSPDARAEYLHQVCGADQNLFERVDTLLRAYEEQASFLDRPAVAGAGTIHHEPSITERPGTVIGPYKLLQQIGEGGMGVVFMAEQTEPIQRTVALKIIKPGMDTRQVIARFEAERQALAMMDHPNIAKVLDAGTTDSGRPYFVMELVKGVPITKYCDEKHLPLRARLELLLPVCQAVQHAHQKGVIHRDIKPSNVLVAEYDDKAVPKVIDFGVAKATAQKLTERTMFTEFGQVVGTVEYMSPEQAKFNQLDIDTRSDIYSLGVLLYELLTGSTPFGRQRLQEAAFDEALRIIREEEPQKPSTRLSTTDQLPSIAANRHSEPARLSKDVRGELDWVVMKALEKDRNRRYETANGFAADIQRYLHDEPVQACSPSATYRFRKFALRNKAALVTAGLIAALLVAAVASLSISNARFRRESAAKELAIQQKDGALQEKVVALNDKNRALAVARENESLARSRFYAAQMGLAQRAWEGGEQARTVELLETLQPDEKELDRRGFEWSYLYRQSHPNLVSTWRAHDTIVTGMAWSPNGAMFATCGWDSGVRLWDGRTGEHRGDLTSKKHLNGWDIAFSPDGRLLVLAGCSGGGDLVVCDVATRQERWRRSAHPVEDGMRALAISPDSRVIATGAREGPSNPNSGIIKLWNADDGTLLTTLSDNKGDVARLVYSPDGKALAAASPAWKTDGHVVLWDLKLPAVTQRWEVKNLGAEGLIFSEDGQTLFAANKVGVRMIDVPTGTLGHMLNEPPAETSALRQVPGKKQIVTASYDRTLRLWNLETRQSTVLGAELASVTAMAIDPKGERIACGDERGRVTLRTLAEPKVPPSFSGVRSVKSIEFAPDGRSLFVGGSRFRVLDGSTLAVLATGPDNVLAISPTKMLAAIHNSANQTCTIWNIKSGERGPSMEVGVILQARFSPDGKQLATWDAWHSSILQLWNTDTGERIERLKVDDVSVIVSVMSVAFSPDGRYLAAALQFDDIGIYDLAKKTWSIHSFAKGLEAANVIEYSPQGNTLAVGVYKKGAMLFDVHPQSGALKLRAPLSGITQGVKAIAFSPDGLSLVTAGADGSVRFSDTATGQERGTITMAATSLTFSPNGRQLAIADDKGTVRVLAADAEQTPPVRSAEIEAQHRETLKSAEHLAALYREMGKTAQANELLKQMAEENAHDPHVFKAFAHKFARHGEWKLAATTFAKAYDLNPADDELVLSTAVTAVETGDLDSYRHVCQQALKRFAVTDDPVTADRTARAGLITAEPGGDLQQLVRLAEVAVENGKEHAWFDYFQMDRGIAAYRSGDWAGTLEWCARSRKRGLNSPSAVSLALLFEAMAHHQLNQADQARVAMDQATAIIDEYLAGAQEDRGTEWKFWLICQITRREAEALLQQKSPLGKPKIKKTESPK